MTNRESVQVLIGLSTMPHGVCTESMFLFYHPSSLWLCVVSVSFCILDARQPELLIQPSAKHLV